MYISDDHVFYGSLTIAFSLLLAVSFGFSETHFANLLQSHSSVLAHKVEPAAKKDGKKIRFRPALNNKNSVVKRRVGLAILQAGYPCAKMAYIRPLALSGLYQATCQAQTASNKSSEYNYIYNRYSGFIHQL